MPTDPVCPCPHLFSIPVPIQYHLPSAPYCPWATLTIHNRRTGSSSRPTTKGTQREGLAWRGGWAGMPPARWGGRAWGHRAWVSSALQDLLFSATRFKTQDGSGIGGGGCRTRTAFRASPLSQKSSSLSTPPPHVGTPIAQPGSFQEAHSGS